MWYFLGVLCDGWIEERLFTVIVSVMAIIKSSCTGQLGWQLSITEGQPFGKPMVINLVSAFVYCICVCMSVHSVGVMGK